MDLRRAQELLRSPRDLTRAEWQQAYETIQEHNIRGTCAPLDDPREDELDDHTHD